MKTTDNPVPKSNAIKMISDRSSSRNLCFGFLKFWKKEMGLRQVEQGFSSLIIFCQIFVTLSYFIWWFLKWITPKALWNFEKSANVTKNQQKMKKSLAQFTLNHKWYCLKPIFRLIPGSPKNPISCMYLNRH